MMDKAVGRANILVSVRSIVCEASPHAELLGNDVRQTTLTGPLSDAALLATDPLA